MTQGVVLLHGIFRTSRSMRPLEKFLRKNGFEVLNIDYQSRKLPIEQVIDSIHAQILEFSGKVDTLHFVGYSMGGLITRAYLTKYRPEILGRVVMLGTPNNGSEMADFVAKWRLYKFSYGPAGQQLVTDQSLFKHILGTVNYELGIIAGSRALDPLASWIIGKPNDGKVSVDSTKIDGMTDHIIIPVDHTFFPSYKSAKQAMLTFIRNGRFK